MFLRLSMARDCLQEGRTCRPLRVFNAIYFKPLKLGFKVNGHAKSRLHCREMRQPSQRNITQQRRLYASQQIVRFDSSLIAEKARKA